MLPSIEFKHLRRREGYPREIVTLGDHIHSVRLDRGLRQKDVAMQLGVKAWTVMNWEKNYHGPGFIFYPPIMEFLGYCPIQYVKNLGDLLRLHRVHLGLTIKQAAQKMGVDPGTLSGYESNRRRHPDRINAALQILIATSQLRKQS